MSLLYLKYAESSIPVVFHGFLCILAYLFWASLAALMLPMLAIYKLFKLMEKGMIAYKKLGTELATFDLVLLHESEENPNYITALMTIKGKPDMQQLRNLVEEKVIHGQLEKTYTRMKQRVSKCYNTYLWRDEENFDIKDHIVEFEDENITTKAQLEDIYTELCSIPFREDISPWQFTIIKLNEKEEMYCIHFKLHHCIGDGFAMVGLLGQLVDSKLKLLEPKKHHGVMAYPMRRVIQGILTGPLALLALMFSRYVRNPFKIKVPPSQKKVSWTNSVDLEKVKLIKNKTDSTVNDVIVSCIAGAIRKYLQGEGAAEPEDLPITMTYNSRSISKKVMDCIPLGNHSGATFLKLPVSIENPEQRLQVTRSRIDAMKRSSDPHLFSFIYSFVLGHLPESVSRLSLSCLNKHCGLVFSNVPGPIEPTYVNGQEIKTMMVTPPLAFDLGVSVAVITYAGSLRLTVLSDQRVISDPAKVTKAFEEELDAFASHLSKKFS